ncbi:putative methionyl-tRNA synthetase [Hordeum vulgare]|nr:putative methionyl-tRNA synthetase [Hordeum vulgare]
MARPSDVSNAVWNADVQRREAVTTDRRNRLIAKKARDMTAAAVADQGEVPRAGMMDPPNHYPQAVWGSQQRVTSSTNFSLSLPPSWGYTPSPGYSNGDALGGFNPNITFPHGTPQRSSPSGFNPDPRTPSPAFNIGLNTKYSYSPSAYPSASHVSPLHRGALPFVPGLAPQFSYTEASMDKIITSDSVAAASCLGFDMQDEMMDTAIDMDDELDDAEEEEER